MIDPNYFSILQITALVYIIRSKSIKQRYKLLAVLITFLAVLTSGSKTGIITLCCYSIFRIIEYVLSDKKRLSVWFIHLITIIVIIVIFPLIFPYFQTLLNTLASSIPSFSRVQLLFTDFSSAISENGSGRDLTWKVAVQLIQLSPVFGVGIGSYLNVSDQLFQTNSISHNTFLQLSAE